MHLGDFVYEVVDYSEDAKDGRRFNRKLNDLVRYPDGEKLHDFHIARTLEDYRTLYRAYLQDPDLQDARARWPFVPVWDNHEFSWLGYQGIQVLRWQGAPRADEEGVREPGMVGVPAGARRAAEKRHRPDDVHGARRQATRPSRKRTRRASATSPTIARRWRRSRSTARSATARTRR